MMNELEKAKALLSDRNIKLTDLAEESDIPYESLRTLRYDLSKVNKASWERVHKLASIYDMRPENEQDLRKPMVIETNKAVYVEKLNKDTNLYADFPKAEKAAVTWQGKKMQLWKLALNEDTFDSIFQSIADTVTEEMMGKDATDEYATRQYDYYFADTDSIEGKDLRDVKIYNITHFLPLYDYDMTDVYLADWLLDRFTEDLINAHVTPIAKLSEGLSAISYPLFKYVFSLMSDLKTRREGLLNSYYLLDEEDNLSSLTLMAYVRIHSKERHPNTRRPDFDPDAYIKQNLESAKEPYDPDDEAF